MSLAYRLTESTAVVEYAIRYCITRGSYAYLDGFNLAENEWNAISKATRDDVLTAVHIHGFPSADAESRWPAIWSADQARNNQQTAGSTWKVT